MIYKKNSKKLILHFPKSYMIETNNLIIGECLTGSLKFQDFILPAIFIRISKKDVLFYNISLKPFNFNWRLRYIDCENNELIEIPLSFKNNHLLNINLNPLYSNVQYFMKLVYDIKNIAFYFYRKEKKWIIGSFFEIDKEEYNWFKKNIQRACKLKYNDFLFMYHMRVRDSSLKERFYIGKNIDNKKLYIQEVSELIEFEEVRKILFTS